MESLSSSPTDTTASLSSSSGIDLTKTPPRPPRLRQTDKQPPQLSLTPPRNFILAHKANLTKNKPKHLDKDQDFWNLYHKMTPAGQGYYGKVWLARHHPTGRIAAVKQTSLETPNPDADVDPLSEPHVLAALSHRNIVGFYGSYVTPSTLFIVMEPALGGSLLDRLSATPESRISAGGARFVLRSLVSALECVHSLNIVHRDIRAANVLLDEHGEVKIGDFGLSVVLPDSELLTAVCGTQEYYAPEMISGTHSDAGEGYSTPADMWGCGLLLYALLYGGHPFRQENEIAMLQAIMSGSYSLPDDAGVDADAKDLLAKLLDVNPARRYTASQCLAHPWLAGSTVEAELAAQKELALQSFLRSNSPFSVTSAQNSLEAQLSIPLRTIDLMSDGIAMSYQRRIL